MKFSSSATQQESKGGTWLKVADVTNRDFFVIKDEIKSGRSQYEKAGDASGMIEREPDGKLFMKTFKVMDIEKIVSAFGDDSKMWVGKKIELVRLISKKWDKAYLAVNPVEELD